MFSQPDHARFLPLAQLHALVAQLMQLGYRCLGPAVENGAIVMRGLDAPDGLPRGLQAEQAAGRYRLTRDPLDRYFAWANGPQAIKPQAFAPKESLWRVERDDAGALQFAAVEPAAPAQAIVGVRACDLAALALQDAHFMPEGRRDAHYAKRREQLFLVAVQCAEPGATCFCASTGDGPTPTTGYDLALAELAEGFVAVAGSAKGEVVLDALNLSPATPQQIDAARQQGQAAAAAQTRSLPGVNLRDGLDEPAGTSALGRGGGALPRLRQLHRGVPHLFLPCRGRRTRARRRRAAAMSGCGIRASARATAICTASTCGPTSAAATASG